MIYFQTFIEVNSVLAQVEETVVGEMFGPYKTLESCVGTFPVKLKLTHCFFRGLDEETKRYFHLYIRTAVLRSFAVLNLRRFFCCVPALGRGEYGSAPRLIGS